MPVDISQSMVTCACSVDEAFSTSTTVPASSFHVLTKVLRPSGLRSPRSAVTCESAAASSACRSGVGCSSTGCVECAAATKRRGSAEWSWWKQSGTIKYSPS